MKGFIFTFSAILLFSLVFIFSVFYFNIKEETSSNIAEVSELLTLANIADDIETDLNKMLGVEVDFNKVQDSTITLRQKIPTDFNAYSFSSWQTLINAYSKSESFSATIDLNQITSGASVLYLSENIRHEYQYSPTRMSTLYSNSGNTRITSIDLNIYVPAYSSSFNSWVFNPAGDINVNFNYSDLNTSNTVSVSGILDSTEISQYEFTYTQGGTLTLTIGDVDSNTGAVRISNDINDTTTQASVDLFTKFSGKLESFTPYYNIDLNLSLNDANIHRRAQIKSLE